MAGVLVVSALVVTAALTARRILLRGDDGLPPRPWRPPWLLRISDPTGNRRTAPSSPSDLAARSRPTPERPDRVRE